jgi:hypothetical protein
LELKNKRLEEKIDKLQNEMQKKAEDDKKMMELTEQKYKKQIREMNSDHINEKKIFEQELGLSEKIREGL